MSSATLRISDNGRGLDHHHSYVLQSQGLGVRNRQERIERLDGTLRIPRSHTGAVIKVTVPLTHMLRPEATSGLDQNQRQAHDRSHP